MFFGLSLTEEQLLYKKAIESKQLILIDAANGTGKTTVAVGAARLQNRPLSYIFAPVQEDKMGFRPGTQEEKEQAYLVPLLDALEEIGEIPQKSIVSDKNIDNVKNGNAWVHPISHTFLRGSNLKDRTIIVDEVQNFTIPEIRKVLTRVHDSSKIILIGNSIQCDLPNPNHSCLGMLKHFYSDKNYAQICHLTHNFRGNLAKDADLLVG